MAKKAREDVIKTTLEVDGEREYKKACKEINAVLRELGSELKLATAEYADNAGSAEALTAKQRILNEQLEQQKKKVDAAEKALKNMAEAGIDNEDAARKLRIELNKAKTAYADTESEVKQLEKAMMNAADEVDDTEKEFVDLGDALESLGGPFGEAGDMLNGLSEKLSGFGIDASKFITPATVGFAGVAAAIGKVTVESVKFAAETDKALVKFSNQTGVALEESEAFRDVMLDIYSDNIGESMEDIAAAMAAVAQATGDTNPEKLNDLTAAALTLRDTFDMDVQESIRAAQQLMNVFGATGESAYDTMAKAAQLGLNKDGNLLDIINEYAIHYSQLGISMDDMFDSLINAKESGVFDLTYAGEAIKEFGVRVREGSDETKAALTTLGLDADEMVKKFNEGGPEAREALNLVVDALNGIDDATVRNQAGVALFGTTWEDLGATGVSAATNFTDKLTETEGAISRINEADLTTIEGAWENLGRTFDVHVKQPLGEWVNTWLPGVLNGTATLIESFGLEINPWVNSAIKMTEDGIVVGFEKLDATVQESIETIIVDGVEMVQAQGPTLGDEMVLVPLRAVEESAPQLENGFLNELKTLNASAVEQVNTEAPEIGTQWTSGISGGMIAGMESVQGTAKDMMFQTDLVAREMAKTEGNLTGGEYDKSIIAGLAAKSGDLTGEMSAIMGGLVDKANSYRSEFSGVGSNSAAGFWEGFSSQKSSLLGKVTSMMRSIVSAAKSALDINSPSKVFEEMGFYSALGYGQGFVKEMRNTEGEISGAMQSMVADVAQTDSSAGTNQYFQIEQHIHAEQTDYAQQQRLAAKNFRMIAREL